MTIVELFNTLPEEFDSVAAARLTKTIQWNISGYQPAYISIYDIYR